MKTIHPQFFTDVQVTCSCGNSFTTGSTKQNISVEVCAKCHPFYTGEQRFLDSKGNVDRFNKQMQQAQAYKTKFGDKKKEKNSKGNKEGKSLRELLGEA